jgi:hypothetical protein
MARHELDVVVRTVPGAAIPGTAAYVYARDTTTQVSVYAASAGGSPLSQPLTTDVLGRLQGWVNPASLDIASPTAAFETFPYEALSASELGGRELGYAEVTSNITVTATTATDITGLSATVTTGSRPVMFKFHANNMENNTLNGGLAVTLYEDGVAIGAVTVISNVAGTRYPVGCREIRRNPSAGSHTYKAAAQVVSGTGTIRAASNDPVAVQVVEC